MSEFWVLSCVEFGDEWSFIFKNQSEQEFTLKNPFLTLILNAKFQLF